ncbi:iron hydrogenase small subunit [Clostridium saccharoperbutylacetonicum]
MAIRISDENENIQNMYENYMGEHDGEKQIRYFTLNI